MVVCGVVVAGVWGVPVGVGVQGVVGMVVLALGSVFAAVLAFVL